MQSASIATELKMTKKDKRPIDEHIYEALKKLHFDDFLHIEPIQHRLENSMLLFVEQKHPKPYEILKHKESDNMIDYDYSEDSSTSQSSTLTQNSQRLISKQDKDLKAKDKGFPSIAYKNFKAAAETCYYDGYGVKKSKEEYN
ncbi:16431_t:CDS:2 [Dentiscutata heterogama]|uniref:16431_t:CDS:1 n=1 Tax=Dentiscutata heterogama TaxID=1316150 RepID=A0ACA9K207_9GLOM|nr:16431_t:CDS:2 [Dentiscutata heterogama]